jgi:uncharacterized protein (TIGR02246 family)
MLRDMVQGQGGAMQGRGIRGSAKSQPSVERRSVHEQDLDHAYVAPDPRNPDASARRAEGGCRRGHASMVDGTNSHNAERVVALYDPEAVLWGTRSPTLRDSPATVRDYFKILQTVPSSYRVVLREQRIRIYGDMAINTGTYTFSEDREGKAITRPARFSFVYRNRDGRWLIVDHHSSAVPAQ